MRGVHTVRIVWQVALSRTTYYDAFELRQINLEFIIPVILRLGYGHLRLLKYTFLHRHTHSLPFMTRTISAQLDIHGAATLSVYLAL